MNLQQITLLRYRHCYPHDTLKEISLKTDINFTRIFRLFNGHSMKVEELEIFEKLIRLSQKYGSKNEQLKSTFDEILPHLNHEDMESLHHHLRRKLFLKKICPQINHKQASQLA
jgi:hypothetical protein